jgi:membrane associated rhomboid family serine protease
MVGDSVDGVRTRFAAWRATHPATTVLVAVLVTAFVVQSVVWWQFGFSTMAFWFAASASPSPGWLLAPLGHQSVGHLFGNLLVLVLFGSFAEEVLGEAETYFTFGVAGLAGNAAQVSSYVVAGVESGAVGASAAVLGLVAFHAVRSLRGLRAGHQPFISRYWGVAGALVITAMLATDLLTFSMWTGTAEYAHLAGVMVGTGGALSHPMASPQWIEDSEPTEHER